MISPTELLFFHNLKILKKHLREEKEQNHFKIISLKLNYFTASLEKLSIKKMKLQSRAEVIENFD